MGLTQTVAPAIEPVTNAEARDHLRISTVDDDILIGTYITAARQYIEGRTNRQFINATWSWTLEAFPNIFYVPRPKLSSVTSIAYLDTAGSSQTLSTDVYSVDTNTEPGRIVEKFNQSWPAIRGGLDSVTVTFVAGYGATTASVDDRARLAIMQLVGQWHEIREPVVMGSINDVPRSVEALINQIKIPEVEKC